MTNELSSMKHPSVHFTSPLAVTLSNRFKQFYSDYYDTQSVQRRAKLTFRPPQQSPVANWTDGVSLECQQRQNSK